MKDVTTELLPVVPLRDMVVFPRMKAAFVVGRPASVAALQRGLEETGKRLFLVTQRDPQQDEPGAGDVFEVGVIATILQHVTFPNGTIKVGVEGARPRPLGVAARARGGRLRGRGGADRRGAGQRPQGRPLPVDAGRRCSSSTAGWRSRSASRAPSPSCRPRIPSCSPTCSPPRCRSRRPTSRRCSRS